jgi:hypothetical protein
MTLRHLSIAALAAGLIAVLGLLIGLADPAYYDPETTLDYAAASLNTLGPVATAVALVIWWRVMPVRGVFLIPVAAAAALVFGVGNFLEDIAGLEAGGDLFFYGGAAHFAVLLIAAVVALTTRGNWRWTGLVLLALAAGIGLDSALVGALGWLALAEVLRRVLPDRTSVTGRRALRSG